MVNTRAWGGLSVLYREGALMRVVAWNPMSTAGSRLAEIDMVMKKEAVVILSGTQMRQRWGRSNEKRKLDNLWRRRMESKQQQQNNNKLEQRPNKKQ